MKRIIIVLFSLISLSGFFLANSAYAATATQWMCKVQDARGAVWTWYANTNAKAKQKAFAKCSQGSGNPSSCTLVTCTPPVTRWRCIAHDSPPSDISPSTWYWDSTNKQTAITNARDACLNHSKYGGCYVSKGSCTSF